MKEGLDPAAAPEMQQLLLQKTFKIVYPVLKWKDFYKNILKLKKNWKKIFLL